MIKAQKRIIVCIIRTNYITLNNNLQVFIIIIGDFYMKNYSVGNRIRKLRVQKHLSQEQVALRAGITTAYLGQIEREEKNPTVKLIEKISNVLELSLSDLFCDQELNTESTDGVLENIIFELRALSEKDKKEILEIIKHIIKIKDS